jgi:hypothetical protein
MDPLRVAKTATPTNYPLEGFCQETNGMEGTTTMGALSHTIDRHAQAGTLRFLVTAEC